MHFELGDVVYYNPSIADLPPQNERPRDRGIITKIKDGYTYVSFSLSGYKGKILPNALDYNFTSAKGIKYKFEQVLKALCEATITRQNKLFRLTYDKSLKEMLRYYSKYIDFN
jgi:hypothetical protein